MSVFTAVPSEALDRWLRACGAGTARRFEGVSGGVENTNYFLETGCGCFVLTLFEWMPQADAERLLAFTDSLARAGLPVARPWAQADGWTSMLCGKPAALATWLEGVHPETPTLAQCTAIGDFLGRLHTMTMGSDPKQCLGSDPMVRLGDDARGVEWRNATAELVRPTLEPAEAALLDRALTDAAELPELPAGAIHADLFRDNALFVGDTLTGVIDFHYACRGPFAYDLAVAVLDWCPDDTARQSALLGAYAVHRPLSEEENAQWPRLMRLAALRFWLSRARDLAFPRSGRDVLVKNPSEMRDCLARGFA